MVSSMALLAGKRKPLLSSLPHIFTWRRPTSQMPMAGTMVLDTFTEEFEVGSRKIILETGKIARFANGSVVFSMDGTRVLSTVAARQGEATHSFLPLTVDYQEKQFAQHMIPSTYTRREGAPKERELLCGRLIDRPIRPLFPAGFYHEVQVTAMVRSSDGKQDPDVMAANATSAALMLSDVPWGGPIGMIRIGRVDGQFIINPTMEELSLSDLNLVYACTKDKTLMIDVHAKEISERDLEAALRLAHPEAVKYVEPQIRLAKKAGKKKGEYKLFMASVTTYEKIRKLAETKIEAVFTDPTYGKFQRGEALDEITQEVKSSLLEEGDEESIKDLPKTIDSIRNQVVRTRVLSEGLRLDGRCLDEVRPLYCEVGYEPELHGSSLFSRGETQVVCAVTLGDQTDAQRLDSLVGPASKRFMLHYSFPPFCINEVAKRVGLNRREVGHGALAEKALVDFLPPEDDFPYTVRLNADVMASDGSTSMATICGGSMALMHAGIPLKEHVAGLSVGLVSDVDPLTGNIKKHRVLVDILGLEDHLGDMDLKIAGTRNGITAIQLDIKPAGIPLDIICECFEPARKGRLQILDRMEQEIKSPRSHNDEKFPRFVTLTYNNDALRRLLGLGGSLKKKIEEETGARILVTDGKLILSAKNEAVMEKVLEKVYFIIGREIEVGGIYKGIVTSIKEYGAFVEFNGGQQGLLHISELSHIPVPRVSDAVSIGQQLLLKCIGRDVRGNVKLSLKATLPQPDPEISASIGYVKIEQENGTSSVENMAGKIYSLSSIPPVIIRSAAECDEEEKLAGLNPRYNNDSRSLKASIMDDRNEPECNSTSSKHSFDELNQIEVRNRTAVGANKLKIGAEVKAKVHQIRAHGLVLDLGGGVRGMYRFETGGKRDFEIGDTLVVRCSSFSSKGIPIMSPARDDQ